MAKFFYWAVIALLTVSGCMNLIHAPLLVSMPTIALAVFLILTRKEAEEEAK